jgi:superfamily II DNA or RNA helicase
MAGKNRNLIVWATGLGKTVLMAHIVGKLRKKRALIIVNREELVWQTVDKIKASYPNLNVSVEKAEYRSTPESEVVVASIQTIGSTREEADGTPIFSDRIKTIDPNTFDVVIVDETHRASADSYRNVLKYFGVYLSNENYNDNSKVLFGLTATPNRADNKGLDEFYDSITANRDIRWGIQNKYLTDIEAYRVETRVDISDVKITAGDFNHRQLEKKINIPARNELVVKKYIEITGGKKALFFTLDIQHAEDLAAELNKQGVSALPISSRTPDARRKEIFAMHKSGEITALTGANIFLEGYDDPTIEVGCMVRPFRSGLIYRQAVGRVLRPCPAPESLKAILAAGKQPDWVKEAAIIIDFVDVSSRHTLITVPTLFGLSPKVDIKGKRVEDFTKNLEDLMDKLPEKLKKKTKLEEVEDPSVLTGIVERVSLVSIPETPGEISKHSSMSWIKKDDTYILNMPTRTMTVRQNSNGGYDVKISMNGVSSFAGAAPTLEDAISRAERRMTAEEKKAGDSSAAWRSNPISDKQISLLAKIDRSGVAKMNGDINKYKATLRHSMNAGQAQALISSLLAKRL